MIIQSMALANLSKLRDDKWCSCDALHIHWRIPYRKRRDEAIAIENSFRGTAISLICSAPRAHCESNWNSPRNDFGKKRTHNLFKFTFHNYDYVLQAE